MYYPPQQSPEVALPLPVPEYTGYEQIEGCNMIFAQEKHCTSATAPQNCSNYQPNYHPDAWNQSSRLSQIFPETAAGTTVSDAYGRGIPITQQRYTDQVRDFRLDTNRLLVASGAESTSKNVRKTSRSDKLQQSAPAATQCLQKVTKRKREKVSVASVHARSWVISDTLDRSHLDRNLEPDPAFIVVSLK